MSNTPLVITKKKIKIKSETFKKIFYFQKLVNTFILLTKGNRSHFRLVLSLMKLFVLSSRNQFLFSLLFIILLMTRLLRRLDFVRSLNNKRNIM